MANKYKAKKVKLADLTFDSQGEYKIFILLTQLKQSGVIQDFKLQGEYILQEGYINPLERKIRAIKYKSDFEVWIRDRHYTIDFKGFLTATFKLKKKIFEYKFNRPLHVVYNKIELLRLLEIE